MNELDLHASNCHRSYFMLHIKLLHIKFHDLLHSVLCLTHECVHGDNPIDYLKADFAHQMVLQVLIHVKVVHNRGDIMLAENTLVSNPRELQQFWGN